MMVNTTCAIQEIFEHYEEVNIGEQCLLLSRSEDSNQPFSGIERENIECTEVGYDKNCFQSYEHLKAFIEDISINKKINFKHYSFLRKAEHNVPEYIIKLATSSTIAWTLFKYIVKPTAKEIAIKLSDTLTENGKDLIDFLNTYIKNGLKYAISKKKVHYVVECSNEILQIELIAKISEGEEEFLIKSLTSKSKLERLAKEVFEYYKKFPQVQMLQFILNDKGKWQFNYMLTSDGCVIGRKVKIKERNKVLSGFSGIDINAIIVKALNEKKE